MFGQQYFKMFGQQDFSHLLGSKMAKKRGSVGRFFFFFSWSLTSACTSLMYFERVLMKIFHV